MSLEHPADDALQAFALGDVEPGAAVPIALHIDDCPRCAARAAGFDPLATALAADLDPELPDGLVAAILAADPGPVRPGVRDLRAEPMVAVALMAASALLMMALGRPTELLTSAAATARVAGAVASPVWQAAGQLPALWAGLGAVGLACAVVVAQRRDQHGRS